jgi:Zn finger protein HypA/HybF involved in hydrogenase expression
VSHLRPETKTMKRRRADCRKGRHIHGESQNIGAGILRRVCEVCGDVSIDLTKADELSVPLIKLNKSIISMAAQRPDID